MVVVAMNDSSKKPHYRLIQFDVDGTLVLSEMRNRHAIEQVTKAAGVVIVPDDWKTLAGNAEEAIYEKLINMHPDSGLETMFLGYNSDPKVRIKKAGEQFSGACQFAYKQHIDRVEENKPLREVFDMAIQKALYVSAVSNSLKWSVHASLDHVKFPVKDLCLTLTKDDVLGMGKRPKPHPDPWEVALAKINADNVEAIGDKYKPITPEEVLVVGDSHTDVKSAIAAGMDVLQITDDCDEMIEADTQRRMETFESSARYAFLHSSEIVEFVQKTLDAGERITPSYPDLKCG